MFHDIIGAGETYDIVGADVQQWTRVDYPYGQPGMVLSEDLEKVFW